MKLKYYLSSFAMIIGLSLVACNDEAAGVKKAAEEAAAKKAADEAATVKKAAEEAAAKKAADEAAAAKKAAEEAAPAPE